MTNRRSMGKFSSMRKARGGTSRAGQTSHLIEYSCFGDDGESVHVEDTRQSGALDEARDGAGFAAQSVACGFDSEQRCMLLSGDGAGGHPVFIKRGAGVAARAVRVESRVSLLVSAPRRQARILATDTGSLESGAGQLRRRGASAGARQAEHGPLVRRGCLTTASRLQ